MQLNSNLTLSAISFGVVANLLTPMSDHRIIFFSDSINSILSRQVSKVKKYISQGIISDPIPNSPNNIMRII